MSKQRTRRGAGEGTIDRRKDDGRWYAALDLGSKDGKRDRKWFYGKTRKEVQDKLDRFKVERQQGTARTADKQTVAQFLDLWLEAVARPRLRPGSYRLYESLIRMHIKPALGRVQLAKLTPQHVHTMLAERHATLSVSTLRKLRCIIHSALDVAEDWGHVARNVASKAPGLKAEPPDPQYLTPAQARQFLEAVKGDRLEALYTVALSLGLRQGEALALRWADVDLDTGTLHVRRTLQRIEGTLVDAPLKTKASQRSIGMPAVAITALRAHRLRQLQEQLWAGSHWEDHDLVFCTPEGRSQAPTSVRGWFHAALQRAGLPDMRFHDLRHSCASLLIAQGVHLKAIQAILGHSDLATTANVYSHVIEEVKREAAGAMDRALGAE